MKVTDKDLEPTRNMYSGYVTQDIFLDPEGGDGLVFPCFFRKDTHWNGWACPAFTLVQAQEFLEAQRALELKLTGEAKSHYDPDRDCFVVFDAGYPEEASETFRAENGLYWVGSFEWCWEELIMPGGMDPRDL